MLDLDRRIEDMDDELRDFLDLRTEGESFRLVKSGQKIPAMEIWRLLAESSDPETDRGTFLDMGELLHIKRCSELSNIRARIVAWEEQVEQYQNKAGETIPKDLWKQSILAMCPQSVADELDLVMDKLPTYLHLRTKVLKLAAERTRRNHHHRGLFSLEGDSEEQSGGEGSEYAQVGTDEQGEPISQLV